MTNGGVLVSKSRLLNQARWYEEKLVYGRHTIAFRYMIGNQVRVFVFSKFKKYEEKILQRKDTYEFSSGMDEWKEILCDVREWAMDLRFQVQ